MQKNSLKDKLPRSQNFLCFSNYSCEPCVGHEISGVDWITSFSCIVFFFMEWRGEEWVRSEKKGSEIIMLRNVKHYFLKLFKL